MTEAGLLQKTEQATTLPEAQRGAQELRSDLETRGVHRDVLRYCRAELLADKYFHAKQEAVKRVAGKIQGKTGLTDDGAALVDRALASIPPMLAANALVSVSERSEQVVSPTRYATPLACSAIQQRMKPASLANDELGCGGSAIAGFADP